MEELEAQTEAKKKGLAIKFMRQRMNWSQADLSEKSSISRISISKIELGKVIPNGKTILKLCKALEITESELITNSFQLGNNPKSLYEEKFSEILIKLLLLRNEGKNL